MYDKECDAETASWAKSIHYLRVIKFTTIRACCQVNHTLYSCQHQLSIPAKLLESFPSFS